MKKIVLSITLAGSIFAANNLAQSFDLGFTNTQETAEPLKYQICSQV